MQASWLRSRVFPPLPAVCPRALNFSVVITHLPLAHPHARTAISIKLEDFNQRGGLGKAHQLFGAALPTMLEELNTILVA